MRGEPRGGIDSSFYQNAFFTYFIFPSFPFPFTSLCSLSSLVYASTSRYGVAGERGEGSRSGLIWSELAFPRVSFRDEIYEITAAFIVYPAVVICFRGLNLNSKALFFLSRCFR
ncbi:hypothetical protein F5X97DRAFT_217669 [Nemania serpens]|nr:hypothetical protein F5X97DRAFT_217669 [Nemania serpens]